MPWIATIRSLTETTSGYEVGVVLTDTVSQKFEQKFQTDGSLSMLRSLARQRAAVADEIHGKPEISVGMTVDLTPDPVKEPDPLPLPPEPTDEEQARTAWFTSYGAWQQYTRGLAAELPGFDAGTASAMHDGLVKRYLPDYASGL